MPPKTPPPLPAAPPPLPRRESEIARRRAAPVDPQLVVVFAVAVGLFLCVVVAAGARWLMGPRQAADVGSRPLPVVPDPKLTTETTVPAPHVTGDPKPEPDPLPSEYPSRAPTPAPEPEDDEPPAIPSSTPSSEVWTREELRTFPFFSAALPRLTHAAADENDEERLPARLGVVHTTAVPRTVRLLGDSRIDGVRFVRSESGEPSWRLVDGAENRPIGRWWCEPNGDKSVVVWFQWSLAADDRDRERLCRSLLALGFDDGSEEARMGFAPPERLPAMRLDESLVWSGLYRDRGELVATIHAPEGKEWESPAWVAENSYACFAEDSRLALVVHATYEPTLTSHRLRGWLGYDPTGKRKFRRPLVNGGVTVEGYIKATEDWASIPAERQELRGLIRELDEEIEKVQLEVFRGRIPEFYGYVMIQSLISRQIACYTRLGELSDDERQLKGKYRDLLESHDLSARMLRFAHAAPRFGATLNRPVWDDRARVRWGVPVALFGDHDPEIAPLGDRDWLDETR